MSDHGSPILSELPAEVRDALRAAADRASIRDGITRSDRYLAWALTDCRRAASRAEGVSLHDAAATLLITADDVDVAPETDARGKPGPKAKDPWRARWRASSPSRQAWDAGHLRAAFGGIGQTTDAAGIAEGIAIARQREERDSLHRVAQDAADALAHARHPGGTRTARRRREDDRAALAAGQGRFAGFGWAMHGSEAINDDEDDGLDEEAA